MPSTCFVLTGVGLDLDSVSVDRLVGRELESRLCQISKSFSIAIANSRRGLKKPRTADFFGVGRTLSKVIIGSGWYS